MAAPGFNYRLSDILCAVGLPQLRRLASCTRHVRGRRGVQERLRDLPVLLPRADDGDVHGWQAYVVQVERPGRRAARAARAGNRGADRDVRVHGSAPYRDQGAFPGADRAFERRSRCRSTLGSGSGARPGRGGA